MVKHIADSLKNMASGEAMSLILDRGQDVFGLERELLQHWSYDLFERKPGPAYFENGALQPTDLDLACFLSALVDRHAVINLPTYKSRRPTVERTGERVLSAENRHGRVMGLTANKEVFSFSVRIEDQNVIQAASSTESDKSGTPRNFMLVDLDGTWHEGWSKIEFMPSAKENAFLEDKKLWTGNTVVFKNFVHPNRWISFYGKYYFLTKALIQRLEEENTFYRKEEKRMLAQGFQFPTFGEGAKKEWPQALPPEDYKTEMVKAFEAEVDAPWKGEFPMLPSDTADREHGTNLLVKNAERIKERQYWLLPRLRFAARATELAFFQAGHRDRSFPAWIKGASWDTDYKEKGKRTLWNRLVLTQLYPGQIGFALRYRIYEKSERVAV